MSQKSIVLQSLVAQAGIFKMHPFLYYGCCSIDWEAAGHSVTVVMMLVVDFPVLDFHIAGWAISRLSLSTPICAYIQM